MSAPDDVPVVLIHGWAGSFAETWQEPGIDALLGDAGRIVVGVDLPGHGNAEKWHEPSDYLALPDWLLATLEQIAPVVDVAAFSLGALTTLRAMQAVPGRFRRVLLAGIGDSVFEPTDRTGNDRIVAALEGRASDDDAFAQAFARYARDPRKDLRALTAIMKRPPISPLDPTDLGGVGSEVRIVIGDADFMWPADRLVAAIPGASLAVLRGTDHFATPGSFSFIDEILAFLGS
jgi:pimeloyl-ACP methyl ester carboxylesterase